MTKINLKKWIFYFSIEYFEIIETFTSNSCQLLCKNKLAYNCPVLFNCKTQIKLWFEFSITTFEIPERCISGIHPLNVQAT